jgi:hypothetical protein
MAKPAKGCENVSIGISRFRRDTIMMIEFITPRDLGPLWDRFVTRIWDTSELIKIVYSMEPGRLLIELKGSVRATSVLDNQGNKCYLEESVTESPRFHIPFSWPVEKKMIWFAHRTFRIVPGGKPKSPNILSPKKGIAEKETSRALKLGIKLQKEVTSYLHYHLPLCIILGNDQFLPWVYGHFTNICLRKDLEGKNQIKGLVRADYLENKFLFSDIATLTNFSFKTLKSMVTDCTGYIVDKINQNFYVIIYLDEFHIPNKTFYGINHYVHQSLIYGYDLDREVFLAVGFDKKNLLCEMEYGFGDFLKAYHGAFEYYIYGTPWAELTAMTLFRLKNFKKAPGFSPAEFRKTIIDYLDSKEDPSQVNNIYKGEAITYGIKLFQEFADQLELCHTGESIIDYRAFHLFSERANSFLTRLIYLNDNYKLPEGMNGLIGEYEKIAKSFNSIRLSILKQSLKKNKTMHEMYSIDDDMDIGHFATVFKGIVEQEKVCLPEIVKILSGTHRRKKSLPQPIT